MKKKILSSGIMTLISISCLCMGCSNSFDDEYNTGNDNQNDNVEYGIDGNVNEDKESNIDMDASPMEKKFLKSNQIQTYQGTVYTIYEVSPNTGLVHLPIGEVMGSMIIYDGYVYYDPGSTGDESEGIFRMKLDGTEVTPLIKTIPSECTFYIYNDVLYCADYNTVYEEVSVSIDLNTLEVTQENYYIVDGSEDAWLISENLYSEDYEWMYSDPGFINVQYWTKDYTPWKVYKDNFIYRVKYSILKASKNNMEDEVLLTDSYMDTYFGRILGNGLYYEKMNGKNYLYRYDLETGTEVPYDILNWPGLENWELVNEIDGYLYYKRYVSGITQLCVMDITYGDVEHIGQWYEI